jgi:hypothetical protein
MSAVGWVHTVLAAAALLAGALALLLAAYQFAADWMALSLAAIAGGGLLIAGWGLQPSSKAGGRIALGHEVVP